MWRFLAVFCFVLLYSVDSRGADYQISPMGDLLPGEAFAFAPTVKKNRKYALTAIGDYWAFPITEYDVTTDIYSFRIAVIDGNGQQFTSKVLHTTEHFSEDFSEFQHTLKLVAVTDRVLAMAVHVESYGHYEDTQEYLRLFDIASIDGVDIVTNTAFPYKASNMSTMIERSIGMGSEARYYKDYTFVWVNERIYEVPVLSRYYSYREDERQVLPIRVHKLITRDDGSLDIQLEKELSNPLCDDEELSPALYEKLCTAESVLPVDGELIQRVKAGLLGNTFYIRWPDGQLHTFDAELKHSHLPVNQHFDFVEQHKGYLFTVNAAEGFSQVITPQGKVFQLDMLIKQVITSTVNDDVYLLSRAQSSELFKLVGEELEKITDLTLTANESLISIDKGYAYILKSSDEVYALNLNTGKTHLIGRGFKPGSSFRRLNDGSLWRFGRYYHGDLPDNRNDALTGIHISAGVEVKRFSTSAACHFQLFGKRWSSHRYDYSLPENGNFTLGTNKFGILTCDDDGKPVLASYDFDKQVWNQQLLPSFSQPMVLLNKLQENAMGDLTQLYLPLHPEKNPGAYTAPVMLTQNAQGDLSHTTLTSRKLKKRGGLSAADMFFVNQGRASFSPYNLYAGVQTPGHYYGLAFRKNDQKSTLVAYDFSDNTHHQLLEAERIHIYRKRSDLSSFGLETQSFVPRSKEGLLACVTKTLGEEAKIWWVTGLQAKELDVSCSEIPSRGKFHPALASVDHLHLLVDKRAYKVWSFDPQRLSFDIIDIEVPEIASLKADSLLWFSDEHIYIDDDRGQASIAYKFDRANNKLTYVRSYPKLYFSQSWAYALQKGAEFENPVLFSLNVMTGEELTIEIPDANKVSFLHRDYVAISTYDKDFIVYQGKLKAEAPRLDEDDFLTLVQGYTISYSGLVYLSRPESIFISLWTPLDPDLEGQVLSKRESKYITGIAFGDLARVGKKLVYTKKAEDGSSEVYLLKETDGKLEETLLFNASEYNLSQLGFIYNFPYTLQYKEIFQAFRVDASSADEKLMVLKAYHPDTGIEPHLLNLFCTPETYLPSAPVELSAEKTATESLTLRSLSPLSLENVELDNKFDALQVRLVLKDNRLQLEFATQSKQALEGQVTLKLSGECGANSYTIPFVISAIAEPPAPPTPPVTPVPPVTPPTSEPGSSGGSVHLLLLVLLGGYLWRFARRADY